ncbi:M48 family metalloprotease [Actinoplanes sp. NPDC049548]|uniref:M48 family metalloprotease n=1 Tax=Actinoplanes sp. NPDC049548 TaxID=3155152 RepID=UPI0034209B9B
MTTPAATAVTPARSHRPLSPSRGQYVLLLVVLVLTGTFAGILIFNDVFGPAWGRAVSACFQSATLRFPEPLDDAGQLARSEWAIDCAAGSQHQQALMAVAGGALVLVAGLVLSRLLPAVMMQRLGAVRPPLPAWEEMMRRVAGRRSAQVVLGPPGLTEPFTVRHQRKTRIVLPAGMRRLPDAELEAVLRHEHAHVTAGDVGLVWLSRGIRWALPAVALLPPTWLAVRCLAEADRTLVHTFGRSFWLEYGVRVAALLTVAYVLAAKIGRLREHEADLRAAAGGSTAGLTRLLSRGTASSGLRRRLTASHPSPERRKDVLARPETLTRLDIVDDVAAGLLAGVVLAAVRDVASPGLVATPLAGYVHAIAALAAGLLVATTWGQAVWRRAADDASWWHGLYGPLAALTVSLPVGLMAGVGTTGVTLAPYGTWWSLLPISVAVAGACACSAMLARAWQPAPVMSVVINTVLFGLALWMGPLSAVLGNYTDPGDYLLLTRATPWTGTLSLALLCGSAVAWHRRREALPVPLVLGSALAAAAAAFVVRRLMTASIEADVPQAGPLLDMWSAAAAGVAVALAIGLVRGIGGLMDVLRGAPAAAILAGAALWLRSLPAWDHPGPAAWEFAQTTVALTATALVVLAAVSVLVPPRGPRTTLLVPMAAAVASAVLTASLVTGAGHLTFTL